ncbi:MAG: hypothetical protein E5Y67_07170 [Mesorhizobium sp.]|uniref:peptidoglycan-binding domain-containing protein n=1 Tax=Mesorhizobium sp. TaxID=1871066 RepID=UPI0012191F19|nr:peptidoglycan-binding domain-containing protein [Mesorhizobium sp.]TIM15515.1 MAG: hypothetical protein E5Y67_07170 [Mesorhizobium sp.]
MRNYHFGAIGTVMVSAVALSMPGMSLAADLPIGETRAIPEAFTQVALSKDGRWAALYGSEPGIRLLNTQSGDRGRLLDGISGIVSSSLFDEASEAVLVFEDVEDLRTRVHRVPTSNPAAIVSFEIDAVPSDTVRGPNQTVILADSFAPTIVVQRTSCEAPQSSRCEHAVREFKSTAQTAMSRVGYTGPSVNYVLAAPNRSGQIFAYDYSSGDLAFTIPPPFRAPNSSSEAEGLSIGLDVAFTKERVTIYFSLREDDQHGPQQTIVYVTDIDISLKEWFPIIHIRSAAEPHDEGKQHRVIGSNPADGSVSKWEELVREQRPKVALSQNQDAIFLLDGRSALAQLRREGGSAFVPVDRYHTNGSIILDFAVSDDGRRLAVLLPHELLVLPVDAWRDPFQGSEERSLIAAVQRKLTKAGFYLGIVHGEMSDQLRQSLHNYQRARGLPDTGLGEGSNINTDTLAELFADDLGALPKISDGTTDSVFRKLFTRYYTENIRPWVDSFAPQEFLVGFETCSYSVADPDMWPNVGRLAIVLDELRRRYGRPLKLERSEGDGDCTKAPATTRQAHEELRAVLIAINSPADKQILTSTAKNLIEDGYPIEEIEDNPGGLTITVKPFPSDLEFDPDASLALISTYEQSKEGCRRARDDAADYLPTLRNVSLQGARLVVVERSDPNTDTFQFGLVVAAQPGKSRLAVDTLRQVARTRTGRNTSAETSLVRANDWRASEKCFANWKIG